MKHKPLIGLMLAGLAGMAGALGLLFLVNVLNGGGGFGGTTAATSLGWAVPLISGLTIAILAVFLLPRGGGSRSSSQSGVSVECAACGGKLRAGWRLCPHCGIRVPAGDCEDGV